IRNDDFKLVRLNRLSCDTGTITPIDEFYRVDQAVPIPKLDNAPSNLLAHQSMTSIEYENYHMLLTELAKIENSIVDCPGDGNEDGVVDQRDVDNWRFFSTHNEGRSSWYDFNHDGFTREDDLAVIQ